MGANWGACRWRIGAGRWRRTYTARSSAAIRRSIGSNKTRAEARIVNIASVAAVLAGPAMAPYNVSKAGVLAFSETLHTELRSSKVGITVVCPGFFASGLLSTARIQTEDQRKAAQDFVASARISPANVAEAIVRAIDRRRLYVVLPRRAAGYGISSGCFRPVGCALPVGRTGDVGGYRLQTTGYRVEGSGCNTRNWGRGVLLRPQASKSQDLKASPMLNLKSATDSRWLAQVDRDLESILIDHAHCEKKAAGTAMSLIFAYGGYVTLCRELADIVVEELDHFRQVLDLLEHRSIRYRTLKPSSYGRRLNELVRKGEPGRAVDRLIIASLIEARSCERFSLLREHVQDQELAGFYGSLFESEARHHSTYVRLATLFTDEEAVHERLEALANEEAAIIAEGDELARMHS